jgi:hypothetical protein
MAGMSVQIKLFLSVMYNQSLGDSRYYQDQVVKIENGGLFSK